MPAEDPGSYPNWEALTADALLSRTPCILWQVVVTADAGGATTVRLYDGANANARRSIRVKALADTSRPVAFTPPLHFAGGLYVDVGTNILEALVSFTPLSDAPVPRQEEDR